jgi:hypothetical protein
MFAVFIRYESDWIEDIRYEIVFGEISFAVNYLVA